MPTLMVDRPRDRDHESTEGCARYRIVTITPAYAAVLLNCRRASARRHAGAVRLYSQAMREGRWILNGMPVVVSREGMLLDGMQRLTACIESETSFPTFLSEDVAADACHTLDQHRRRTFANVLEARGVPYARALQAALVKLLRYEAGTLGEAEVPLPPWAAMERALHANPDLIAAVSASLAMTRCPLPEPVRSPLVYMGYRVDRGSTERLLDAVARPANYLPSEPGVVLRHLIERRRALSTDAEPLIRLLALAIEALNATMTGVEVAPARWLGDRKSSSDGCFPVLAGYTGLARGHRIDSAPGAATSLNIAGHVMPDASGVTFAIESIDARRAAQYLAHNTSNRRISQAHVAAIARDIAQGRWMFNAQPICFADTGQLLNGQHRLQAVIDANGEIELPVVRGLSAAAYATYDVHARRGADMGDRLDSFGDRALICAMANLLWRNEIKPSGTRNAKATAAEIQQIIVDHPRLLILRSVARRLGHFGRASVIGYAAYVMEREDTDTATRFLAALETGIDERPGRPILTLRTTLQKLRARKASQSEQLATLLAGWRQFTSRTARTRGRR